MRRLSATVAAGLALAVLGVPVPVARADGDPASDVLYTRWLFLPFEVKFDAARTAALQSAIDTARKRGFPIKVALITQKYDLGTVPQLFAQPQRYAEFLGLELTFLYKGRLLVVMPNGLGLSRAGRPVPRERSLLAGVRIVPSANGMEDAATEAVRKLAAAHGVRLPVVRVAAPSSGGHDRLIIGLAAAGAALLIAAAWAVRAFRRRRSFSGRSP
jgi:hypothetical protein